MPAVNTAKLFSTGPKHAIVKHQNKSVHLPVSKLQPDRGNHVQDEEILQTSPGAGDEGQRAQIPEQPKKPRKNAVIHTERTDDLIRRAYTSAEFGKAPMLERLSAVTGIKPSSIHRRAVELGVQRANIRQRPWSDAEVELIKKHADKTLPAINETLVRAGYKSRSLESIRAKLRKQDMPRRQSRYDAGIYSLNETGKLMGVHANTVKRWVEYGMLKATLRDDCKQTEYLISAVQLRRMIIHHTPSINVARIDKYWLVDILTRRLGELRE